MLPSREPGDESLGGWTPLPGVLRKNINLKELYVRTAQEFDSRGVTGEGAEIERVAWFENGKDREAGRLYTR
jgi:hypothetical protein